MTKQDNARLATWLINACNEIEAQAEIHYTNLRDRLDAHTEAKNRGEDGHDLTISMLTDQLTEFATIITDMRSHVGNLEANKRRCEAKEAA